ncbi:CRISPR-associated protein Cas4 [Halostagnicola bangensis]
MSRVAFSDLRSAAYCPRKCYYDRRRDERDPPATVEHIRSLAFRYEALLEADANALAGEPIKTDPDSFRRALEHTRSKLERADRWDPICNPAAESVLATGRDVRGIVHKVLSDPLEPALVSTGKPPETGVWESQSVHAVAAAKALAWEHETPVEGVWLEYPSYGVVRRLEMTTRRKARYRRVLRTVRELDGPPARIQNDSKCEACEYAGECGVRTRTLRSLLGLG